MNRMLVLVWLLLPLPLLRCDCQLLVRVITFANSKKRKQGKPPMDNTTVRTQKHILYQSTIQNCFALGSYISM